MYFLQIVIAVIAAYVLGSLPFAVMVAKKHGVDIFKEGSGNPGATNVKRVLGKRAGNTVFALDCIKGLVAVSWWQFFFGLSGGYWAVMAICSLVAAILGHSFSVFMKFRGGKGVATTMGGLLGLTPFVLLVGIAVWLIAFFTSRYVSLASILFGVSLPISGWLLNINFSLNIFYFFLAALIVLRHRSNIERLLAGTENRFTKTKASS